MTLRDIQEAYRYNLQAPLLWRQYKYDSSFNPNKYKRKLYDAIQFSGLFLIKRREFQNAPPFAHEITLFDIGRLHHVQTKYSSKPSLTISEVSHGESASDENISQKPELSFHSQTVEDRRFCRSPGYSRKTSF